MLTIPYSTSLLLRGNGVNNATSIVDDTGKVVTAFGNARVSDARSRLAELPTSIYCGGAGDYWSVPASTDFDLNGPSYTIEAWVNLAALPASNAYMTMVSRSWDLSVPNHGWWFGIKNDATLGLQAYFAAGVTATTTSAATANLTGGAINTWAHLAVVHRGTGITAFVNGVPGATVALPVANFVTTGVNIGCGNPLGTNPWFLNGYLSELRIVRGYGLYLSAFTPPAAPLTLLSGEYGMPSAPLAGKWQGGMYRLAPPGAALARAPLQSALRYPRVANLNFNGNGKVKGSVKENGTPGTPLSRKVVLIRDDTMICIRSMWSNAQTGEYEFTYVDPTRKYTVISYDYLHNYRAVIADNITPEPIP